MCDPLAEVYCRAPTFTNLERIFHLLPKVKPGCCCLSKFEPLYLIRLPGAYAVFSKDKPIFISSADGVVTLGAIYSSVLTTRHFYRFRNWFERADCFSILRGDVYLETNTGLLTPIDLVDPKVLAEIDASIRAYVCLFYEISLSASYCLQVTNGSLSVKIYGAKPRAAWMRRELRTRICEILSRHRVVFPLGSRCRYRSLGYCEQPLTEAMSALSLTEFV